MRRLRAKIEPSPKEPRNLLTVHGVGWRLVLRDQDARGLGSGQAYLQGWLAAAVAAQDRVVEARALFAGFHASADGGDDLSGAIIELLMGEVDLALARAAATAGRRAGVRYVVGRLSAAAEHILRG